MSFLVIDKDIPQQVTEKYETLEITRNFLVNFNESSKAPLIEILKNQDIYKIIIGAIDVEDYKITKAAYELIVEVIETCKNVDNISLYKLAYDFTFEADTKKISNALEKLPESCLGWVSFYYCDLSDKLDGLLNKKNLVELNLSHCNIGTDEAAKIAKIIQNNPDLKTICLNGANITDEVAKIISEGLKSTTKLKRLQLQDNEISEDGYNAIKTALSGNKNPDKIATLRGNPVQPDDGLTRFIHSIATKARDNKYLCSDKQLLATLEKSLYKELLAYKDKDGTSPMIKEMTEIGNRGNTINDKQKQLVDECVKILNQNYIKDIKHKNPIMCIAQMIWHVFAYIFYKADPKNNHNRGYQTIENYAAPTNFVEKVVESRKQQAEHAIS